MTIPTDKKDQAIYHTIMGEMHRMRGVMLNMQTLDTPDTESALREHFGREQNLVLGRLMEWKQRRHAIYQQAHEDFQRQIQEG